MEPWSSGLVLAAESVHLLELSDACGTIRDLLSPAAEVTLMGRSATAPIAYSVAFAADGCVTFGAARYIDQVTTFAGHLDAPAVVVVVRHPACVSRTPSPAVDTG